MSQKMLKKVSVMASLFNKVAWFRPAVLRKGDVITDAFIFPYALQSDLDKCWVLYMLTPFKKIINVILPQITLHYRNRDTKLLHSLRFQYIYTLIVRKFILQLIVRDTKLESIQTRVINDATANLF